MAYFTDPMADEFRKAIEEALKEGGEVEDPDATKRAKERKKPSDSGKPRRTDQSKKKTRRTRKRFSPKIAKSLK